MRIAMSRGVVAVATDIGHQSEAAFNRAFKRHRAPPPGDARSAAVKFGTQNQAPGHSSRL